MNSASQKSCDIGSLGLIPMIQASFNSSWGLYNMSLEWNFTTEPLPSYTQVKLCKNYISTCRSDIQMYMFYTHEQQHFITDFSLDSSVLLNKRDYVAENQPPVWL